MSENASAVGELIAARTSAFAPLATDNLFRPAKVAAEAQANLVDKLGFSNPPEIFVQGPNNIG